MHSSTLEMQPSKEYFFDAASPEYKSDEMDLSLKGYIVLADTLVVKWTN